MPPILLLIAAASCLLSSHVSQGKPFGSDVKICSHIYLSYPQKDVAESDANVTKLRERLRVQIGGCQYVQGDVTLKIFGSHWYSKTPLPTAFPTMDTDFLDSIEEIAGRLVIWAVNLERLTFRNLRVIRGYNLENKDPHYAIEIAQFNLSLKLELPRLTAILGGDVKILGELHPSTYCYLVNRVDWKSLFGPGASQRFDGYRSFSDDCSRELCSDQCKNCWSDGPVGCQASMRTPCHPSCLGGCSSSGPKGCHSCLAVNRDGACASSCSGGSSSPALWQLLHLCVKSCPLPYLRMRRHRVCVSRCPDGEIPNIDAGSCEWCGDCGAVCETPWLMLSDSDDVQNLLTRNCKLWGAKKGSLRIDLKTGGAATALVQLRVFYGQLLLNQLSGANYLHFLGNLEFVSDTFTLMRMKLRYLGLAKLRYARWMHMFEMSGLCRAWFPFKLLKKFRLTIRNAANQETFDDSSEECRRAACDRRCGDGECWGPGPDMCVTDWR